MSQLVQDRLDRARESLRERMERAGYLQHDGWRIAERLRASADGATRWILMPIHTRLAAPPDLDASFTIGTDGEIREG